jgi:hypothetical protein
MKRTLLTLSIMVAMASLANAQEFNNWTTESLKLIFIPTAHITYDHGKIKTVVFPFGPKDAEGYPPEVHALELFHLLFMFLFGPKEESAPHTHNLADGGTPGVISMKDPETGYLITRDDYVPPAKWRYHFTVAKDDTTILTAELIPSEDLGPRFILPIKH